jgi:hypothetical protein
MLRNQPLGESPDISAERMQNLLRLLTSTRLGQQVFSFLKSELNPKPIPIVFDTTLGPTSSQGLYFPTKGLIALNPHEADCYLTTVIAHEAAHHHQHLNGLLTNHIYATMRHILTRNIRDKDHIRQCLLTYALPYKRLTEFDAFGRQAIYTFDYLKNDNNLRTAFAYYTGAPKYDRLRKFINAFCKLSAAEENDMAELYRCGAENSSLASRQKYDIGHLSSMLNYLCHPNINWAKTTADENLDRLIQSHPLDYYARKLDDDVMWSVLQNQKTVSALDTLLYEPFPLEAATILEEAVDRVLTIATAYDLGHYHTNRPYYPASPYPKRPLHG